MNIRSSVARILIFCMVSCVGIIAVVHSAAAEDNPTLSGSSNVSVTNSRTVDAFLRALATHVEAGDGFWTARYNKTRILVYAHEKHDRMRIVAPIASAEELSTIDMQLMLEANFDRAIDAKYSIYNRVVWSIYSHPLSRLTQEEFEEGLNQVAALRKNYGSTYASTNLFFADLDQMTGGGLHR